MNDECRGRNYMYITEERWITRLYRFWLYSVTQNQISFLAAINRIRSMGEMRNTIYGKACFRESSFSSATDGE